MKRNSQSTAPKPFRQPITLLPGTTQADIHTFWQVRTLLADDCPLMLKTLARILELEGNFVLVGAATDGRKAVRQAFTMEPELVLLDYRMPYLDGIQATRCIKQFEDPPLVIIVTSDDTPECRSLAKAAGADGLVIKGEDLRDQLHLVFEELFQFAVKALPCPEESKSRLLHACG